jgi:hypothetical protein
MNRRGFLTGLIAAPVVIRTAGLLMPIRKIAAPEDRGWQMRQVLRWPAAHAPHWMAVYRVRHA